MSLLLHKHNNGLGCADLGIAMRAYELAKEQGRGLLIDIPEHSRHGLPII